MAISTTWGLPTLCAGALLTACTGGTPDRTSDPCVPRETEIADTDRVLGDVSVREVLARIGQTERPATWTDGEPTKAGVTTKRSVGAAVLVERVPQDGSESATCGPPGVRFQVNVDVTTEGEELALSFPGEATVERWGDDGDVLRVAVLAGGAPEIAGKLPALQPYVAAAGLSSGFEPWGAEVDATFFLGADGASVAERFDGHDRFGSLVLQGWELDGARWHVDTGPRTRELELLTWE